MSPWLLLSITVATVAQLVALVALMIVIRSMRVCIEMLTLRVNSAEDSFLMAIEMIAKAKGGVVVGLRARPPNPFDPNPFDQQKAKP